MNATENRDLPLDVRVAFADAALEYANALVMRRAMPRDADALDRYLEADAQLEIRAEEIIKLWS